MGGHGRRAFGEVQMHIWHGYIVVLAWSQCGFGKVNVLLVGSRCTFGMVTMWFWKGQCALGRVQMHIWNGRNVVLVGPRRFW